jgi:D-sedoheptulose 7-phosphate isomerase
MNLYAVPPLDEPALVRDAAAKAMEIMNIRRDLAEREAGRLTFCAAALVEAFRAGGRLFAFGNGGSSTDAADLVRTFTGTSPSPLPAIDLGANPAVLTALANDVGFSEVFARQLDAFARPEDIAVGLSTSGGSQNVLRAFEQARRTGLCTVGLCGGSGGALAESGLVEHLFVVRSDSIHRIQEAQATLSHVLWALVVGGL